jgi:ABC-type multidrug transport system ATPase subunit
MAEAPLVTARAVERSYGARRVLRDVSFALARGDALLVTGPNGAGKTTLLRLLVGLAVPSRGTIDVALHRSRLGFVGHEPLVYRELTAVENLDLYGRLYRVPERR